MITQKLNAIQPLSLAELAVKYEVSEKVLRRWFLPHQKAIGKKRGQYYNILQVKKIFEIFGVPGRYILQQEMVE